MLNECETEFAEINRLLNAIANALPEGLPSTVYQQLASAGARSWRMESRLKERRLRHPY